MKLDPGYPYRFKQAVAAIEAEPLTLPPGSRSVFYSGPERGHGKQSVTNRQRADAFAEREGASNLERTARGKSLEAGQDAVSALAAEEIGPMRAIWFMRREWDHTSRDFGAQAFGHVKAFVAGAARDRVFRDVELLALVNNANVQTVNGFERTRLYQIYHHGDAGPDRAYRTVVLSGLRQDLRQSLRTGNQALIRDAIAQQALYRDQKRLDAGRTLDTSPLALAVRAAEIDRRALSLATRMQAQLRLELTRNLRLYSRHRIATGLSTPESAAAMQARAAASIAANPEKTFRLNALIALKLMREQAVADVNPAAIHKFVNAREQYQEDCRAARQASGERYIANRPEQRDLLRYGQIAKYKTRQRRHQSETRQDRAGHGRNQPHGSRREAAVKLPPVKPASTRLHLS